MHTACAFPDSNLVWLALQLDNLAQASANGASPAATLTLDTPTAEHTAGLVFGPGEAGAWDDTCVGNPVVCALNLLYLQTTSGVSLSHFV